MSNTPERASVANVDHNKFESIRDNSEELIKLLVAIVKTSKVLKASE